MVENCGVVWVVRQRGGRGFWEAWWDWKRLNTPDFGGV